MNTMIQNTYAGYPLTETLADLSQAMNSSETSATIAIDQQFYF